jgi:hypothetical protein
MSSVEKTQPGVDEKRIIELVNIELKKEKEKAEFEKKKEEGTCADCARSIFLILVVLGVCWWMLHKLVCALPDNYC